MKKFLIAVAIAFSAGVVIAAPVNYQESVGGDLPTFASGASFTLGAGVNTIAGQIGSWPIADFDSFSFTLGSGLFLQSLKVELTDLTGDITFAIWELTSGAISIGNLSSPSPGEDEISGLFGPGFYSVQAQQISTSSGGASIDANYVFTLTVLDTNAVPEPGSLALLGLGLAGLAAIRKRKQA